jgi:hypothetical protein
MGPPARVAREPPPVDEQVHPPQGPIGATPRMRGPNEGHPRNGTLERVSGTCPSESASQRAPTCDCQGEVATSGQVGATPQVATPNCDPNGAARESRARAASGRRTGPPPPRGQSGPPPECGGPMGATPGTGPWNVSPAHVRQRAPVRERQHVIARARSPQAARLGPPPKLRPKWGHPRESRAVRPRRPDGGDVHDVQSGPPPKRGGRRVPV